MHQNPNGERIRVRPGHGLQVPAFPLIPFIEGDGIGADIGPVCRKTVDTAVHRAYGNSRRLLWHEVLAGGRARSRDPGGDLLPPATLDALRDEVVSLKGPLATPVGEGWRSLNVTIRQALDLYACVRPIRYFPGVTSPVRHPESVDMIVFRENTEDIYTGIEWPAGSDSVRKVLGFLEKDMGIPKPQFAETMALGLKPVSRQGSERLIRKAIQEALLRGRRSVTLVHKGNIMKYTEGGFCRWGYDLAVREFGAEPRQGARGVWIPRPAGGTAVHLEDLIADNFFQQALLNPGQYDVIATLNLNGDYLSDALAAQVGGIGIAPGANIGDGVAVFEATHGTAPDLAGTDTANPCSLLLSAEMLLRYIGWIEAADGLMRGIRGALSHGFWTPDLIHGARALHGQGVTPGLVSQSETGFPIHPVGTRGMGEAVCLYMDVEENLR